MFIALSRFIVANEKSAEVRQAFIDRPHLVDDAAGFLRMEVLSPQDNKDEFWLMTYWQDEQSYQNWHRSHKYLDSHKSIPSGLKLQPRSTEIRFFDLISS